MNPRVIALQPDALLLEWDEGGASRLSAKLLREACRCAECQSARLRGTAPPVAAEIALTTCELVGAYAVQLIFSDGHQRGIYPWQLLRELG